MPITVIGSASHRPGATEVGSGLWLCKTRRRSMAIGRLFAAPASKRRSNTVALRFGTAVGCAAPGTSFNTPSQP
jgi:hypothetical protein